jgi:threonine/homoserine/homoserine lactone efflux protein
MGLRAAWAHAAGVALYALLTVLGVSAVLTGVPALFTTVQLAGALYLLYLAQRLLRSGDSTLGQQPDGGRDAATPLDAFTIAFLNPKLALFMLALFSQFVDPDYGARDFVVMVATAGLIDGGWYSLVAVLLTRSAWLGVLQARALLLDRLFGLMLAVLALVILAELLLRHMP